jgi:CRISPR-associated protein Cas1
MKILPSKRAHLYVLERSRVYVRDGRVEYTSDEGREPKSFNVPIANTSFVLLGPGSSLTNEAARMLKADGVCIGFCGSGGTPLLSGDEHPSFLMPADEYRDPSYLHRWIGIWSNANARLAAAKRLMLLRADEIERCWSRLKVDGPLPNPPGSGIRAFQRGVQSATEVQQLLGHEGSLTVVLYKAAAISAGATGFERRPRQQGPLTDPNRLLDHGNYLAYGLAGVVLWTLGIPASLAVAHGKTRKGGLVFDLADVVKDAIILPLAFNVASRAATEGLTETDFRSTCIEAFDDLGVLDTLFSALQSALEDGETCLL